MSIVVFLVKWFIKSIAFMFGVGHKAAVKSIETSRELYPEAVKAARSGYRGGIRFKFELPDVSDDSEHPDE
jgi:hypothetical protein